MAPSAPHSPSDTHPFSPKELTALRALAYSVADALTNGTDIIPRVDQIRQYETPRRVTDTKSGATIRAEITMLERFIEAQQANVLDTPEFTPSHNACCAMGERGQGMD